MPGSRRVVSRSSSRSRSVTASRGRRRSVGRSSSRGRRRSVGRSSSRGRRRSAGRSSRGRRRSLSRSASTGRSQRRRRSAGRSSRSRRSAGRSVSHRRRRLSKSTKRLSLRKSKRSKLVRRNKRGRKQRGGFIEYSPLPCDNNGATNWNSNAQVGHETCVEYGTEGAEQNNRAKGLGIEGALADKALDNQISGKEVRSNINREQDWINTKSKQLDYDNYDGKTVRATPQNSKPIDAYSAKIDSELKAELDAGDWNLSEAEVKLDRRNNLAPPPKQTEAAQ